MATLQVALVEPVSVKKAIFNQTVVNVTREPTMGLIVNVSHACTCTTNRAIAMYIAAR